MLWGRLYNNRKRVRIKVYLVIANLRLCAGDGTNDASANEDDVASSDSENENMIQDIPATKKQKT